MIARAVPLITASLLALCAGARADGGSTIEISGYVRDNACEVAGDSKDFEVDLLKNSARQLRTVGAATPQVLFRIFLSRCGGSATAVRVGYSGPADDENSALLRLDPGGSAASGAGIQILDHQQVPLPINAPPASLRWITLHPGESNTLNFYARLMATRVPVTAGQVRSTATFTVEFQ